MVSLERLKVDKFCNKIFFLISKLFFAQSTFHTVSTQKDSFLAHTVQRVVAHNQNRRFEFSQKRYAVTIQRSVC